MTDGLENASRIYNRTQIAESVKHQTDVYKWAFIYLGANQDAITVGKSMGFAADHSANYQPTSGGILAACAAVSTSTNNFRSGNSAAIVEPEKLLQPV